jgi:arylsulfatase A-like enzyme
MLKRAAVLGILFGCLLPLAGCDGEKTAHPNVLLVVLDTTRRDRLSTYGHSTETSPALDRVAAEGLVYDQCISAGSWTLPSHASIFTGMYPRDHGTTVENWNLDARFTTLAELLSDDGYATAGFCCNPWIADDTGLLQGFDVVREIWRGRKDDRRDEHGAARTTEEVLAWLDARGDSEQPFFAFVNYLEPHTPYRPPQPFRDRFLPPGADPVAVQEVMSWKTPREFGYMLGVPGMEISKEQFAILDGLYDAEVAYQDMRFGELIDGLVARGLLDETLLVVVADHGEQLGEHGMLDHKMSLYEENVHVPLVLRYPPAVPVGRVGVRVQSHDIFMTVLELAGVDHPAPPDARRLPLHDAEGGRPYAFVGMGRPTVFMELMEREWPGADVRRFDRALRAVQGPRFKYVWASDGERKLYDVVADPAENTDLFGSRPEDAARLDEVLKTFHEGGGR